MTQLIALNFHSHSIFSDGDQTPEALAVNLARSGVKFAALTDHDTTDGTQRFNEAAKKNGIITMPGVEISTRLRKKEIHLLAYGFEIENLDVQQMLQSIRQTQSIEVQSIAGSIRKLGSNSLKARDENHHESQFIDGYVPSFDAISIIHNAGGKVFLAHPFQTESNYDKLGELVKTLKSHGLDGIEAYYAQYSDEMKFSLLELADRNGLLVSAGTDLHSHNDVYSIEIPNQDWKNFRDAIFKDQAVLENNLHEESSAYPQNGAVLKSKHHSFRKRAFALRVFLPTLFAIGLFLSALWGIILPSFEETLLDRKREMIRELTQSAWSILVSFEKSEETGLLTREQAQEQAIAQISALRYGPEGKDYFWLQDLQPRMLMHPYRPDLNGQDVSTFTDPNGNMIFVEFANLVQKSGEGYVDYVWQWKDEPSRLEPKQSYVKGFTPWGWVIGTGIYVDDVRAEIQRIEKNIINVSLVISGIIIALLLFVLQQSMRIEKARQDVVDSLNESTERYQSLSEATTEGTLLLMNDRCRFANQTFLAMTGYSETQLEFLELSDLLPRDSENELFWKRFDSINLINVDEFNTMDSSGGIDGSLLCKDGSRLDSVLLINPIVFSNQRGFILISKKLARGVLRNGKELQQSTSQMAPVGVFRARNNRRGTIEEMNQEAQKFFNQANPHILDILSDEIEYDEILKIVQTEGELRDHRLFLKAQGSDPRVVSFSLKLNKPEDDTAESLIGVIRDETEKVRSETERNKLIERMQASLLFLHEPLSCVPRNLVQCDLQTSISDVAKEMSDRKTTAAIITSEDCVVGIITDFDLRTKAIVKKVDYASPVLEIMSAPVNKITESSPIYEALMIMEENEQHHLAVCENDGKIVNVVDAESLMQFNSYGMVVVNQEISRAENVEEIAEVIKRIPMISNILAESSSKPKYITSLLSSIADTATRKIIQLSIQELGTPPIDFAFISMGSQGREEQTLITDQDNGIIYNNPLKEHRTGVDDYFSRLGTRVCDDLAQVGYKYCQGKVMANNPIWCRSIHDWVKGAERLITNPEPDDILNLSIFFDFRAVMGNEDIENDFRQSLEKMLEGEPPVFFHLAKGALNFKPPVRLLGTVYLGGNDVEHPGEINLKDAIMPIVSFARLYALKNNIHQTNTIERLKSLYEKGLISKADTHEIISAYEFLMQIRLQSQLNAIKNGLIPTNVIHLDQLGYMQKEQLKQAFTQITALQKKVSYDFLGGG